MKAIKFVILGFGVLGLISIFLPYAKVGSTSFSAWDIMQGVTLAEDALDAAQAKSESLPLEGMDDESQAKVDQTFKEIDEALDTIKGIMIVLFAPTILFVVIGGIGAARGKLERVGGAGVMVLGLIGLALNSLFLMAWGSAEVKAEGGDAGIAQYLLVMSCVAGFVCGLLTLIKPDRGGKFG